MGKKYVGATIKVYLKSGNIITRYMKFDNPRTESEYNERVTFIRSLFKSTGVNMYLSVPEFSLVIPSIENVEAVDIEPRI